MKNAIYFEKNGISVPSNGYYVFKTVINKHSQSCSELMFKRR